MNECDHVGFRVYAVRSFSNVPRHYCVQCTNCYRVVRLEKHNFHLWLKKEEVPLNRPIHEWVDGGNHEFF